MKEPFPLVVVQSLPEVSPLTDESMVFDADRKPLGNSSILNEYLRFLRIEINCSHPVYKEQLSDGLSIYYIVQINSHNSSRKKKE